MNDVKKGSKYNPLEVYILNDGRMFKEKQKRDEITELVDFKGELIELIPIGKINDFEDNTIEKVILNSVKPQKLGNTLNYKIRMESEIEFELKSKYI